MSNFGRFCDEFPFVGRFVDKPETVTDCGVSRMNSDFLSRTAEIYAKIGNRIHVEDVTEVYLLDANGDLIMTVQPRIEWVHLGSSDSPPIVEGGSVLLAMIALPDFRQVHFAVMVEKFHCWQMGKNNLPENRHVVTVYKPTKDVRFWDLIGILKAHRSVRSPSVT